MCVCFQVNVSFTFVLSVTDASLPSAKDTQDLCADHIQTALNTNSISTLSTLSSSSGSGYTCGSGVYQATMQPVLSGNTCNGFRRHDIVNGTDYCCKVLGFVVGQI